MTTITTLPAYTTDSVAITILLGLFGVLLVLRVPITFSLLISAFATAIYLNVPLTGMVQTMVQGITNFSLLAIPFFIIAGQLIGEGGITQRLLNLSNGLVGWIPGGLAQVNVLASMFFGGISGSAIADISSEAPILLPIMQKKGYDMDFSVAITVASACQGVLIPPSHNMVILAWAAGGLSVGRLLIGGIAPGVLLGVALMIYCFFASIHRGYPRERFYSIKEIAFSVWDAGLGLMTFVIILGGVTFGIFTATESAAIACVYALIITVFIYREVNFQKILKIFYSGFKTLAMVMTLIAAASAFGYLLARLHVPALATDALLKISHNKILLLLLINALLLFLGCIMDMAPLILICTPILKPVVVDALGMDPIQFGMMVILNLAIGLCTPPVGSALFVACAIGKISIEKATKALLPFYVVMIAVLLLVTFVPIISTFIPNLLMPEGVVK